MVSGCLERSVPPCFSLGPALLTTVTIPGTVTLRRTDLRGGDSDGDAVEGAVARKGIECSVVGEGI